MTRETSGWEHRFVLPKGAATGGHDMATPFRPSAADLARIGDDVAPISAIQQKLLANHSRLTMRDRVAHQYQVAGGKVLMRSFCWIAEIGATSSPMRAR